MGNYYQKNKPQGIIEIIFTTIGRGIWFVISWPFKKLFKIGGPKKLNKEQNIQKWSEIEKLLESNDEVHAKHAVVEADKFFDDVLKQKGAHGETFADRLRSLENHFNTQNYQLIWHAHKLRNQISHEHDFHPSTEECRQALYKFLKGLKNLGAI